jgi:hypothetical protein
VRRLAREVVFLRPVAAAPFDLPGAFWCLAGALVRGAFRLLDIGLFCRADADFDGDFELDSRLELRGGGGTSAPSRRASESPIAIACFLLVTFFFERPERSFPRFSACISSAIFCPARGSYLLADFWVFLLATNTSSRR